MAIEWDLYSARLNSNGTTERDRLLNGLQNNISSNTINSLSCKTVKIGTTSYKLIIDSTDNPNVKKYSDVFNILSSAGTIVEWNSNYWLVETRDVDNEVYSDGKLRLCNYELKFLNSDGQPTSKHCCVTAKSQSLDEKGTINHMVMGSAQYSIQLPFDAETALLDRRGSDGKNRRLLVDYGTNEPKAYEVTFADRVTYPGIITLSLTECQGSDKDNPSLMIADYYDNVLPVPTEKDCEITYIGDPILYFGQGFKKLTCVSEVVFTPIWSVLIVDDSLSSYILRDIADNYIKLKVTSELLIGKTITLTVSNEGSTLTDSIELEVRSIG